MLFVIYILLVLGYSFFVIAIPRFVHDMTAFTVYSVHDRNRNQSQPHNMVYKKLAFLRLSPLILCPLIALVLANSIQCGSFYLDAWLGFHSVLQCAASHYYAPDVVGNFAQPSMQFSLQALYIIGLSHYYIESFVWKQDGLHRRSLSFG